MGKIIHGQWSPDGLCGDSEPHGYDAGNIMDDCHSGDGKTPVQRYLASNCRSVYFIYVHTQGQNRLEGKYGFVFLAVMELAL